MSVSADICIRGAGIVGRCLALLLARERLRIALVESPREENGQDVRAYALNATSRGLLEGLRCWPEPPAVTPVREMQVHGDAGGQLHFGAGEAGAAELGWIVDVPALEQKLTEAVRFQPQIVVVQDVVSAPLTVICEGRASQTRRDLGVAFDVTPYEQHAVAARLTCDRPHGGTARQWFRFDTPPDLQSPQAEILALLPLGGLDGREVALVWSVHPSRARQLMAMDAQAFALTLEQACEHSAGPMQLNSRRSLWPLQLARATRWVGAIPGTSGQSFALAGDAAHALHPLAGQGLNVGLGDVAELVRVIRDKEFWRPLHDLRLLRRYERARASQLLAMELVTDGLQRLFARQGGLWSPLRNWGLIGFDRSGPIKQWTARSAMGNPLPGKTSS